MTLAEATPERWGSMPARESACCPFTCWNVPVNSSSAQIFQRSDAVSPQGAKTFGLNEIIVLSLGLGCNSFFGPYLKGNLFTQGKTNNRGIGVKLWSSFDAFSEPTLGGFC